MTERQQKAIDGLRDAWEVFEAMNDKTHLSGMIDVFEGLANALRGVQDSGLTRQDLDDLGDRGLL